MTNQNDPVPQAGEAIGNPTAWEPTVVFFKYANATMFLCAVAFAIFIRLFVPEQTVRYLGPLMAALLAVTGWVLFTHGRIRAAGHVFIIGSWLVVTGITFFLGGVRAPIAVAYPLIIILTGWLIGWRMALGVAGLSVTVIIAAVLGEPSGFLLPPPPSPPALYAVVQVFMCALAAILIYFFVRSYQSRLEDLHLAGQALSRRTREMEESESLQRTMLSNILAGVIIVDPVTRIIESANTAAAAMFGAPAEQLVGNRCHNFLCASEEGACPDCDLGKTVDNMESEMLCHDGSRRTVIKSVTRIHILGREKLLECFVDITERKRAEKLQHETQAILQAAMDQSPVGISIANAPDGSIRYVNKAGLIIRGDDSRDFVAGASINQYLVRRPQLDLDGRPLELDEIPLTRAALYGEASSREFIIQRPDGSHRIVFANAAPIKNQQGEVVAAIAVFQDITERKQDEDALQEAQAILQAAMDQSPAGIVIGNAPDASLRYVNRAGQQIRGADPEAGAGEFRNTDFFNNRRLLHLDGTPLARDEVPLARAVQFGETGSKEFVLCRVDHQDRVVQSSAAPMLRVLKMSGSVARHLSGCHSALKGVRDETDGIATGDPEDEI